MARQRMVTRTIKSTVATALCLNTETSEPFNKEFFVPCNIKEGEAMIKYLRKTYDTDTEKVVSVVATNTTENLYGMSESDFIQVAKIINK